MGLKIFTRLSTVKLNGTEQKREVFFDAYCICMYMYMYIHVSFMMYMYMYR